MSESVNGQKVPFINAKRASDLLKKKKKAVCGFVLIFYESDSDYDILIGIKMFYTG